MKMNPKELVQALRQCASGKAEDCPFAVYGVCGCPEMSADQIERDQKEIEALREENERLTRLRFEPHPVPTASTL